MADAPPGAPARLSTRLVPVGVTTLFVVCAMGAYLLIAHDGRAATSTQTRWDAPIALSPGWVWIYVSPYFCAPFLLFGAARDVLLRVLWRGLAVLALTLPAFALVPTIVERPDLALLDGTSSVELLRAVYEFDTPPRNAAPSGHVSLAMILAWGGWHARPRPALRVVIVVYAALVAWSILPTKQHHVTDLVTGALVGAVVLVGFALWERRARVRAPSSP